MIKVCKDLFYILLGLVVLIITAVLFTGFAYVVAWIGFLNIVWVIIGTCLFGAVLASLHNLGKDCWETYFHE